MKRLARKNSAMPIPIDRQYKYFTIEGPSLAYSGRTKSWQVWNKQIRVCLGYIKWHGAWRCYAFFPGDNTLYEHNCLWDIADFVSRETKEHRDKWKKKFPRKTI